MLFLIERERLVACEPTLTPVNSMCSLCKTFFFVTGIPVAQHQLYGSSKSYCFRCVVKKSDDIRQKPTDELMVYAKWLQLLTGSEPLKYTK